MKRYVLENAAEFDRLEKQSRTPEYDYRHELASFRFRAGARILDAGCGSGIVSRHLAVANPSCEVVGCDFSSDRIEQARSAAAGISNLQFQVSDLTAGEVAGHRFDHVISRFVFHHIPREFHESSLRRLTSVLKPGGQLILIDLDGFLYNIHPQPEPVRRVLETIEQRSPVDLKIGRKLTHLFATIGLEGLTSEIQTLHFTGDSLKREIQMMDERLNQTSEVIAQILGSSQEARTFQRRYLELMNEPGTTLFYNKFIVSGRKPGPRLVKG